MRARSPILLALPALPAFLAPAALTAACSPPAAPPPATEVVAVPRASLPAEPDDPAWSDAPVYRAPLLLQDMVEPRELEPSTREVEVRCLSDASRIAFRLEWKDATLDDEPRPSRFSDACAVQLPARLEPDTPAPQMGEAGKPVEITYWRASWQAVVDGRPDELASLYPGAAIDHYPFEAAPLDASPDRRREMVALYAPPRALGNAMAGPHTSAVEELLASGPGTLEPARTPTHPAGRGRRTAGGWAVVLSRTLPAGWSDTTRTQLALAVWEGAHGETGARKMRTAWIPLTAGGLQ